MPEQTPKALLADKGYDADAIRADLAQRSIEAVMAMAMAAMKVLMFLSKRVAMRRQFLKRQNIRSMTLCWR